MVGWQDSTDVEKIPLQGGGKKKTKIIYRPDREQCYPTDGRKVP